MAYQIPKYEVLISVVASTIGFSVDGGAISYVAAGDYYLETVAPGGTVSLRSAIQTILAAAVASSTVVIADTTGLVTITWGSGVHSLDFNSTATRDLLGFAANIAAAAGPFVSTKQVQGLWLPNCPVYGFLGGARSAGKKMTDKKTHVAQSGKVTSTKYNAVRSERHSLGALIKSKTQRSEEVTTNESWEAFWLDRVAADPPKPIRYYRDRTDDTSYLVTDGSSSLNGDWYVKDEPVTERVKSNNDVRWRITMELAFVV